MEANTMANELFAVTRCLMNAAVNINSVSDGSTKEELNIAVKELKETTKNIYLIMQKALYSFNFEQYYDFLLKNPMAY